MSRKVDVVEKSNHCLLALFVQDEPSLHRYYAQRASCAADGGTQRVLASFMGITTERHPVAGTVGAFALERAGRRITCWHAADGEWLALGSHGYRRRDLRSRFGSWYGAPGVGVPESRMSGR